MQIIEPRSVALGSDEGMRVRRTLPTRMRSLIGGWCFIDHYGPDPVDATGGMQVAPHPHTQLQTASWLFSGEVEHRDSAGHHAMVRPGELNLMTAGRGISHSEMSTGTAPLLHGVQLWIALPRDAREVAPTFEHHVPEQVVEPGLQMKVFIGDLLGSASPARTHSALVGAEIVLEPGREVELPLRSTFEHGVLVDEGSLRMNGELVAASELAALDPGERAVRLEALAPTRLLLLGGEPLGEQIVMFWNFIGRTHEEIAEYRAQWQAEVAGTASTSVFGMPIDDHQPPLSSPELPASRLKPRG